MKDESEINFLIHPSSFDGEGLPVLKIYLLDGNTSFDVALARYFAPNPPLGSIRVYLPLVLK